MAVGADFAELNSVYRAGYVRLLTKSGNDWNSIQQINGTVSNGRFGSSVALSQDGSTLAIASWNSAIYIYSSSSSSSEYSLLDSKSFNVIEVALSADGSVIGVTSNDNNGARIYARSGDSFLRRGSDFSGYGRHQSGIALNYDGTTVIIGDRNWPNNLDHGRAGVFQWKDDNNDGSMQWIQMGNDITRNVRYDYFGHIGCVSITHDGLTVAIGSPNYDGNGENIGLVSVHQFNITENLWNKVGSDLVGEKDSDRFSKPALSSDGKYLVVGAYIGFYVKVFGKNGNGYEIIGDKVTDEGGRFGQSVDISDDGLVVAIGAFDLDNQSGKAYLYLNTTSASTENPSQSLSLAPTITASLLPSEQLSLAPTAIETFIPSTYPSSPHSNFPTTVPSNPPTTAISDIPTVAASFLPSLTTTFVPSTIMFKTDFSLTFISNETAVDFTGESPDNEITIKTLISKKAPRDTFNQTVLVGTDCQFKLTDEFPDDSALIVISNNENLDEEEGVNRIKITSKVDIDTTHIVSKGRHATDPDKSIYSEYVEDGEEMAKIEFCIRTDYGKVDIIGDTAESSVTHNKVKIAITFPLQLGFNSATTSVQEAEESEIEQTGTISEALDACACPSSASSRDDCLTNAQYDQNDILSVCIYDPNANAIITSFKDVTLDNGQISTQVIDSDGKPTSLASVGKLHEGMAMLHTRIVSAFFVNDANDGTSPAPVILSGTAIIGFKTFADTGGSRRKLTAISVGKKGMRTLQDTGDAAALEDEGEGVFYVKVMLSDGEQLDADAGSPPNNSFDALVVILLALLIPIRLF